MTEVIKLPWPASELFAQAWETLKPWMDEVTEPGKKWLLGGGSVLAARWGHRQSTDIDIFLDESSSLGRIRPRFDPLFCEQMHKAGAEEVIDDDRSMKFTFDSGRIEITQLNPIIGQGHKVAQVAQQRPWTMSTAQILAGKLVGRGLRAPERDLFDIAVGYEKDRGALEVAIDAMEPNMRREIIARIEEGKDGYAESAPNQIMNPSDPFKHLMTEAPKICVQALTELSARKISVRWSGKGMQLVKRRGDGSNRTTVLRTEGVGEQLDELGLERLRVGENVVHALRRVGETATNQKEIVLEGRKDNEEVGYGQDNGRTDEDEPLDDFGSTSSRGDPEQVFGPPANSDNPSTRLAKVSDQRLDQPSTGTARTTGPKKDGHGR